MSPPNFRIGQLVQYRSKTNGWIDGTVLAKQEEPDGRIIYELRCRKLHVKNTPADRLRRRPRGSGVSQNAGVAGSRASTVLGTPAVPAASAMTAVGPSGEAAPVAGVQSAAAAAAGDDTAQPAKTDAPPAHNSNLAEMWGELGGPTPPPKSPVGRPAFDPALGPSGVPPAVQMTNSVAALAEQAVGAAPCLPSAQSSMPAIAAVAPLTADVPAHPAAQPPSATSAPSPPAAAPSQAQGSPNISPGPLSTEAPVAASPQAAQAPILVEATTLAAPSAIRRPLPRPLLPRSPEAAQAQCAPMDAGTVLTAPSSPAALAPAPYAPGHDPESEPRHPMPTPHSPQ